MMASLFQIRFLHRYFFDGKPEGFQLVPDEATAQLIARYRLVPRLQDGVFNLYAERATPAFIEYLRDQAPAGGLRFFLIGDPSAFFWMTDLPLDWVGMLALSSARAEKNVSGEIEMSLATLEGGETIDNRLAVVSILLDDLLAATGDSNYVVDFQARTVGWQYYVVNRSDVTLKSPAIIGNNGSVLEGPYACVLPGGEPAMLFSSGITRFPLQQIPQLTFDLVERLTLQSEGKIVERCHVKGLPTPGQHQVSMLRRGEPAELVCAMYVYV